MRVVGGLSTLSNVVKGEGRGNGGHWRRDLHIGKLDGVIADARRGLGEGGVGNAGRWSCACEGRIDESTIMVLANSMSCLWRDGSRDIHSH